MDDEQHEKLLNYLMKRLNKGNAKRTNRIRRYASIDQMLSTWQQLTPEDSIRENREDMTGKSQAIPVNLPLSEAYIDDSVSFYTEVFAPIGGNFYSDPGKRNKSKAVLELTNKMNQDTKINRYYTNITSAIRTIHKYNFGGLHVLWTDGNGLDESQGNKVEAIDVYNLIYDPSIVDVMNLHKEAEYIATMKVRNRLWLIRQATKRPLMNLDKVLDCKPTGTEPATEFGKAKFYRHPPSQTRITEDGKDTRTSHGESKMNWDAYGLGDGNSVVDIDGHEVILMYCWINERQFDLENDDNESTIALYRFTICDAKWIIHMERLNDAEEIPMFFARVKEDELKEAARSIAEHLRPFQRLSSFLVNTHIEALRSSIWGLKGVDPQMFDVSQIKNGETSGLLISKQPGRDVRSGLMAIQGSNNDSRQNLQDVGAVFDLLRQFLPSQAMPAQVAGLQRAVNSQVQAVMHGSMRKVHMFMRNLDSTLMLPVRMAQYRNIALYDPDKALFSDIKDEEVANLLNSGLGQINREAAAEQVRTIIFGLIQNPEGAQGIDMKGLWTLYSQLLNIGTDLGEFMMQETLSDPNNPQGQERPQEGETATQPGMPASASMVAG